MDLPSLKLTASWHMKMVVENVVSKFGISENARGITFSRPFALSFMDATEVIFEGHPNHHPLTFSVIGSVLQVMV